MSKRRFWLIVIACLVIGVGLFSIPKIRAVTVDANVHIIDSTGSIIDGVASAVSSLVDENVHAVDHTGKIIDSFAGATGPAGPTGPTGPIGPAGSGNTLTLVNDTVTGTTVNLLTKISTTTGGAIRSATTDNGNESVGICTSGCGTSGSATIQISGTVTCQFDGATTKGHVVIESVVTNGNCADGGTTYSGVAAGMFYGVVSSTNAGPGAYSMSFIHW